MIASLFAQGKNAASAAAGTAPREPGAFDNNTILIIVAAVAALIFIVFLFIFFSFVRLWICLLYTSPSPRD